MRPLRWKSPSQLQRMHYIQRFTKEDLSTLAYKSNPNVSTSSPATIQHTAKLLCCSPYISSNPTCPPTSYSTNTTKCKLAIDNKCYTRNASHTEGNHGTNEHHAQPTYSTHHQNDLNRYATKNSVVECKWFSPTY